MLLEDLCLGSGVGGGGISWFIINSAFLRTERMGRTGGMQNIYVLLSSVAMERCTVASIGNRSLGLAGNNGKGLESRTCLTAIVSVSLFVWLIVCLSVCPSICLCLRFCLSVCLLSCPRTCICMCVCVYVAVCVSECVCSCVGMCLCVLKLNVIQY